MTADHEKQEISLPFIASEDKQFPPVPDAREIKGGAGHMVLTEAIWAVPGRPRWARTHGGWKGRAGFC